MWGIVPTLALVAELVDAKLKSVRKGYGRDH